MSMLANMKLTTLLDWFLYVFVSGKNTAAKTTEKTNKMIKNSAFNDLIQINFSIPTIN